jgi:hypothetical protein
MTLRKGSASASLLLWFMGCISTVDAQSHHHWGCCSPGTLFHWGEGYTGGPDLDEPIVTDRPDFTEASSTVGLHVSQIELGYTYALDDDGTTQAIGHSYPETLLRQGMLANWLELRVGWTHLTESVNGVDSSGSADLYLGFKLGLTPQQGWLPEMAIIPQMTVPTGSDPFSSDKVLPGANWIYAWDLSERISIAGSTQFNRAVDDASDDYTSWAQSMTTGISLTENVGGYAEWFAFFPHNAVVAVPEYFFNGGFTVLLTDDIQWDVRGGTGLNDAAIDYFVGTGLSIRFR